MPVPVPELDDRTFDQLATEARSLIPKYFPEWTDSNPSDPGITILELFAFLVEAAIYQVNRIPDRSLRHFAELIGVSGQEGSSVDEALREALTALGLRNRAVLKQELENLAMQASASVARAVVTVDAVSTQTVSPDEQLTNVIILPTGSTGSTSLSACDNVPTPTDSLRETVFEYLASRRLITSRVHVVGPPYRPVSIEATVVWDRGHLGKSALAASVQQDIDAFLSPLVGGANGQGWEVGRSLYRSELYQRIQGIPGVDHVKRLLLNGDDTIDELQAGSSTSFFCLKKFAVTMVDE